MRVEYEKSWCSHLPLLTKAINNSTGPVLELGSGLFSTPVLYWLCFDQKRPFITYDNSKDYVGTLAKFDVQYINNWDDIDITSQKWGIVFIDHAPPERRHIDAAKVANNAEYVIIHDSQRHLEQHFHYSEIYHLFKYKYVYRKTKPHTTILSNFHDLTKFQDIPSIIHQIWVGSKPMPKKWMDTWKLKNPNMEYKLWTEKEIDNFGLVNRKQYDDLMEKGEYRGASDIARVEILEREGGVYIDADSICIESIENAPFMNTDFFVGRDYDHKRNEYVGRVANGTIGASSHHPILQEYVAKIGNISNWMDIGSKTLTSLVIGKDVVILPTCTFYPENYDGRKASVEGKIYAQHIWGTTLGKYE